MKRLKSLLTLFILILLFHSHTLPTNNQSNPDKPEKPETKTEYILGKNITKKLSKTYCLLLHYVGLRSKKEIESKKLHNKNNKLSDTNKCENKGKKVKFVKKYKKAKSKGFTVYVSHQCPICYQPFTKIKRVFLLPCGHNICKNCLLAHSTKCPVCKTMVQEHISE